MTRIIIYELRKEFIILLAYPIEIVFWTISPLLWTVPLIFQGKALIGGLQSTAFGNLAGTGEYIPYVLIGAIFSTYMFSAIWYMGNSLRNEMFYGTLEQILSAPVKPIILLIGKGLYVNTLNPVCCRPGTYMCFHIRTRYYICENSADVVFPTAINRRSLWCWFYRCSSDTAYQRSARRPTSL
ncbi:hypothetical protein AMJ87_13190 [candidate division WOR_3 bacterium SM23_60]|uniref:ABC-2 type transporter domain-containing protein n=1 Tax=candidate division WOR_3 bacterium SM23_60 TaxID=1703780 RepID=A0A0S8G3H7_UNCW3|nr:MAG: hypothetical protein AMJ87_13190 [candidate division WOR_3 bacterium SM23_60]